MGMNKTVVKSLIVIFVLLAAVVGAGVFLAARAPVEPDWRATGNDTAYLSQLDDAGVEYWSETLALDHGYQVCTAIWKDAEHEIEAMLADQYGADWPEVRSAAEEWLCDGE
jgi:hypothetical protein